MAQPRYVEVRSIPLREGYKTLTPNAIQQYKITIMKTEDVSCDVSDTVFIGDHGADSPLARFLIWGLQGGGFYARPQLDDPTIPITEQDPAIAADAAHLLEVYEQTGKLPDFDPASLPMRAPCFYGQYFDSFEAAFAETLVWLNIDPRDLPKQYKPPIRRQS